MKTKLLFALLGAGALVVASGCVSKVSGGHALGMPLGKDAVTGTYKRPVEQVYNAAVQVIKDNGVLVRESIVHGTNEVKTIEGKINQRNVWMKVHAVDVQLTTVAVQVRTQSGGSDIDLAHELDKEIAVKLSR
jgi:hypothetical protein